MSNVYVSNKEILEIIHVSIQLLKQNELCKNTFALDRDRKYIDVLNCNVKPSYYCAEGVILRSIAIIRIYDIDLAEDIMLNITERISRNHFDMMNTNELLKYNDCDSTNKYDIINIFQKKLTGLKNMDQSNNEYENVLEVMRDTDRLAKMAIHWHINNSLFQDVTITDSVNYIGRNRLFN